MTSDDNNVPTRRGFKKSLREMPSTLFARNDDTTRASIVSKPKHARKGLAGLFAFGSGRTTDHAPTLPGPSLTLPSRVRGLRSTRSGPLQPQNKPRPSCGPDPFVRDQDGARIVQVKFKSEQQPSKRDTGDDETPTLPSPSASPVRKTGTCGIPVVSIDDLDDEDDLLFASDAEGVTPTHTLRDVPEALPLTASPRHGSNRASIVPVMMPLLERSEGSLSGIGVAVAVEYQQATVSQAIKKGKHRSRIFGLMSGKGRSKSKSKATASFRSFRSSAAPQELELNSYESPPVPTLHVTKPSMDASNTESQVLTVANENTMSSGSVIIPISRPLPRRKSLAGLFDLALKKSQGRLRPSTPSRVTTPHKPQTQTRSPASAFGLARQKATPSPVGCHNNSFMADGSLLNAEPSDGEVATVTSRFHDMVHNLQITPTRLSLFRSIRNGDSPLGIIRPTASPRTPQPLSREHANTAANTLRGQPQTPMSSKLNCSQPSTPKVKSVKRSPLTAMVKRGVRHVFTSRSPSAVQTCPESPLEGLPRETLIKSRSPRTEDSPSLKGHSTGSAGRPMTLVRASNVPSSPGDRANIKPPKLSLEFDRSSRKGSVTSESWFPTSKQRNGSNTSQQSFNFDRHLAGLNCGSAPRASFLEAMHLAPALDPNDPSPFRPLPQLREEFRRRASEKSLASKRRGATNSNVGTDGELSFQQFLNSTRASTATTSQPPFPPPPFALPLPPVPGASRASGHQKHESVVSLATISSLGAPLDYPSRDYPNYLDILFGSPDGASRFGSSRSSLQRPSSGYGPLPGTRGHLASRRHSRQSSGISLTSTEYSLIGDAINRRIASQVASEQPNAGSSLADSDLPHCESNESFGYVDRLGRPGLGERMFNVDREVGDDEGDTEIQEVDARLSITSTWSSQESVSAPDHLFSAITANPPSKWLRCPRPLSGVSDVSSSGNVDDTFDGLPARLASQELGVIEAYREESPAVLRHQPTSKTTQTRARLSRPPRLDLVESEMPTPSLTSPSTSDSASLFSLDTRPSNPPQAGFVRSRFQHHQQKASITSVVQIHPTIREETSLSNLRKASGVADGQDRSSLELPADAWELQDDMGGRAPWLAQCNRSFRSQPVALDDCRLPETRQELDALLSQSSQMFRPLAQQPPRRGGPHRRPSLKACRTAGLPYSTALPPPVTRYRNKRGSCSSEDDVGLHISPLLTEFARDCTPSPLPAPTKDQEPAITKHQDEEHNTSASEKSSVSPSVRRRNLGWSRRGNSEEAAVTSVNCMPPKSTSAVEMVFPSFLSFSPQRKTRSLQVKPAMDVEAPGPLKSLVAGKRSPNARRRLVSSRPRPPSVNDKPPRRPNSAPLSQIPVSKNIKMVSTTANTAANAKPSAKARPRGAAFQVAVDKPDDIGQAHTSRAGPRSIPKRNKKNLPTAKTNLHSKPVRV